MNRPPKCIIVSGAGLSASSGIPTYGTDTGLWSVNDMKTICVKGKEFDTKSIEFYNTFRQMEAGIEPSSVHRFLAEVQAQYGTERIKLYTQNIDTLLERAGCLQVTHVHGNISEFKCVNCQSILNELTTTQCCDKQKLRRNIVFYGEPGYYSEMIDELIDLESMDIFVLIGTSGKAINPDVFVRGNQCHKLYVNMQLESNVHIQNYDGVLLGKAENCLSSIYDYLQKWMEKK